MSLASPIFARFLFVLICAISTTYGCAEDRSKIDPNKEQILVTIGGINFDIPLGYFYEQTIWTKGQWPIPNKQRTEKKGSLILVAHMSGMKPWSPQLNADFAGGNARTTRITIRGDHHPKWLENFMAYRTSSLSESKSAQKNTRPDRLCVVLRAVRNSLLGRDASEKTIFPA